MHRVRGQQGHRLADRFRRQRHAAPRFDPKTEQFTVFKSTSRNARVRQILSRPGEVWLPESGADKLVVIRE